MTFYDLTKNETIRKLRLGDYWRIGEHESWFTDMAAQGLHLKKLGLVFARFVKAEPKEMRYRIAVSSNKEIVPEQKQSYTENGWDYVTSYGNFHVFSSPVELSAPELYTDPAEQAYALKGLGEKFAWSAFFIIGVVILMIYMMAAVWFLDSTPTLELIEGRIFQQVILIIVELYVAGVSLQAALSIRALRKRLLEGKPIDHHAPWKKYQKANHIFSIIFIVFAVLGGILPWMQIAIGKTAVLPAGSTDLPIVRLADVEQNPDLVRRTSSHIRKNIDWGNQYSYNWSLLAPVQYESDEHGAVPNVMWEDGSGEYSPSIHMRIYQLSLPSMSESAIRDLTKKYGIRYKGGDFVEIGHSGFDLLVIHEEGNSKEIFASKEKAVTYVRYFGYADINTIIESTAQKLALISE